MDSCVDDLDLPSDWRVVPLGDVAQPRRAIVNPQDGDRLPYVGLEHLDTGAFRIGRWGDSVDVKSSKTEFREGDVLYGKLRPYLDKAALAQWRGLCTTELIAIQVDRARLDPFFLLSLVHSRPFIEHAVNTTGGTNLPRTSWNVLREFIAPLPPLPEQQAIAQVLRTVQRAKEATEKVLAGTKQLKQSLLRHLFTYGPVPFDQADQVELRETPFGSVPTDWPSAPLSECAVVQTGVAKGRKFGSGDDVLTVPYLRVANVQDGYLDLSEIKNIEIRRSEFARFALQVGDVLLTEGGDFDKLGRGFIWKDEVPGSVHQNHIFAVRADRTKVLPEFLSYLIQSPYGKGYFLSVAHRTTHLACINTTKLKALPVVLPPLGDQRDMVQMLDVIDVAFHLSATRRHALDTLFTTLLHHLMTGKVRVV